MNTHKEDTTNNNNNNTSTTTTSSTNQFVSPTEDYLSITINDNNLICLSVSRPSLPLHNISLDEYEEAFNGISLFLDDERFFASLSVTSENWNIDRPSIRLDGEEGFVYITLRKGARHERTIEVETLNEEFIFDFDSGDKLFGLAILNVGKYFRPSFLKVLTSERMPIPVCNHEKKQSSTLTKSAEFPTPEAPKSTKERKTLERPPFLVQVCQGNFEAVQELYAQRPSVIGDTDSKGGNVVTLSAAFGHLHILQWAVQTVGLPLSTHRNDGATPFTQAALHGHIKVLEWLLQQGVSVEESDATGDSALMHAAGGGHLHVVKYLLEHGADVRQKSRSGSNVLHRAATSGHLTVVRFLVEEGLVVNVEEVTLRGCTALHYAARSGHDDVVKWLVEKGGCSVDRKDNKGYSLVDIVNKMGNESLKRWLETRKKSCSS